jgi:uncharacterized protein
LIALGHERHVGARGATWLSEPPAFERDEPPSKHGSRGSIGCVNADECIRLLDLVPHPEGGWYRETWRAPAEEGARASGTAIYFLLRADRGSHWHRVDAAEIWHHYAGAPLELSTSADGVHVETAILGPDVAGGERPQIVIDAHVWQAARTLGEFTLVGCTVSPGFEFSGFEMAEAGWHPGS